MSLFPFRSALVLSYKKTFPEFLTVYSLCAITHVHGYVNLLYLPGYSCVYMYFRGILLVWSCGNLETVTGNVEANITDIISICPISARLS
jgi:hypothetical protein